MYHSQVDLKIGCADDVLGIFSQETEFIVFRRRIRTECVGCGQVAGCHWRIRLKIKFSLISSNSGQGYIDQAHKLLDNENLNANMSSFSIFLNLLGKVLKRLVQNDLRNQIQKIMGTMTAGRRRSKTENSCLSFAFSVRRSHIHQIQRVEAVRTKRDRHPQFGFTVFDAGSDC